LKKREWIIGLVLLVALAALFSYEQHRHPFDWSMFIEGLKRASWRKVAIGAGCIYFAFVFRAVRWAWLLRPNKKVPLLSLLGTQVMGFTAVALIGRIADLVRPYLVAKKTGLSVGSQIAVYVVERLFDAGSMALLFCSAILLSPAGSLPHQDVFNKFGKGGLIITIAGGLFLVAVRMSGSVIAGFCENILRPLSSKLSHGVGQKIRAFHSGLDTLRSPADFIITISLSLVMWVLITAAYFTATSAFLPAGEAGSHMLAQCLVLMAGGGVASIIQLPVIGWFTQIYALKELLEPLYGMSQETALACAASLQAITFLGIAPVGLIWAQFEHINLRTVTIESERAGENLAEQETI
jgi:glycosyltransferase 2 family protein